MFPAGQQRRLTASPGYLLADVQHHEDYRPIGIGEDNETCLGFRDMRRKNYVFRKLSAVNQMRVALDALNQLHGVEADNTMVDSQRFVSDTGQVKRLVDAELLLVDAPQVQAIAGSLQNQALTRTSQLALVSTSAIGTLVWISLDGRPAETSQRWSLKMVTMATNTGEVKQLHQSNADRTTFELSDMGKPPITTLGEAGGAGTTVALAGKPLLTVFLTNGTWELVCEGQTLQFYCDTPGVRFSLPQLRETVSLTKLTADGAGPRERVTQPLTYPADVRLVQVAN